MKFDDYFIDRVRDSVSIIDLVGGYVRLKKSGKDYSGLCPFHSEKTPSFYVSDTKQIFKCFGCGAGGDVFKFMMLMENLSFPDAVANLAERYAIALPKTSDAIAAQNEDRARLLKIMEMAAAFFRGTLSGSPAGDEALSYLRNRRIEIETVHSFALGYAPAGNELLNSLKKQGVSIQEALACGLVTEVGAGQYRDRFRHRIMFPIRNLSGKTIAFGGRALGDALPKYLNSPETVLYNKGSHLFGLDVARDAIRRTDFAVLVEGYFDCLVPFQSGFRNVVASLGTSLTQKQVRTLGRYTRSVVINFDPDSAGMTAALRSIDLFLEEGFRVNVVQLPGGRDPDLFIREQGASAYEEKLKSSVPYLDFALSRFVEKQADPLSPRGKQETVSQILPYLMKVPNRIERAEYVSRIAARLQIDEALIRAEMRRSPQQRAAAAPAVPGVGEDIMPAEHSLVAALLDPAFSDRASQALDPALLEGLRTRGILEAACVLRDQGSKITLSSLRKSLAGDASGDLLESLALSVPSFPLSEEVVNNSVRALRRRSAEREIRRLQEALRREEKLNPRSPNLAGWVKQIEEVRRKIELDLL